MKRLSIVCASFVALAALAMTADGTLAGTTVNSSKSNSLRTGKTGTSATTDTAPAAATSLTASKSNTSFRIGTTAGTMEADCAKQGGKVTTNRDGTKDCALPAGTTTVNSSKSNNY